MAMTNPQQSRDTANATLAARHHLRARVAVVGIGAVLAAAVALGIVSGGINQPPAVDPDATAAEPSPSSTGVPVASPARPVALPDGTFAITNVEVPVHGQPGSGEPFATLAGQGFYIRGNHETADGSLWQEIQFGRGMEWIFGWMPSVVDGQAVINRREAPPCPTPNEFANGLLPDAPRLVACIGEGTWLIDGYLIRTTSPEPAPYTGEPAWLVSTSEWALTGAIGPAVTSWQLPVHFDPAPELAIDIDEAWISDREGFGGLRMWIRGHVANPSAHDCRLTATDTAMADPTDGQSIAFCQQRFVVTSLWPGFAEPPGSAGTDLELEACDNPRAGYRVSIPGSWFTVDDAESGPCSSFAPDHPPSGGSFAIALDVIDGGIGFVTEPSFLAYEQLEVGGFRAWRSEMLDESGVRVYRYVVTLGDGPEEVGPTLLASTTDAAAGDFATNRLVLDVMMRSLELLPEE
jgi:hypothetical protein